MWESWCREGDSWFTAVAGGATGGRLKSGKFDPSDGWDRAGRPSVTASADRSCGQAVVPRRRFLSSRSHRAQSPRLALAGPEHLCVLHVRREALGTAHYVRSFANALGKMR